MALSISLTSNFNPSIYGESVGFIVNLSQSVNGLIYFYTGAQLFGVAAAKQPAVIVSFYTTLLPPGTNSITAVLLPYGDPNSYTSNVVLQVVNGTMVGVNNFPASQVVTLASTTITGSVAVTGSFYPYTLGQQLAAASVPVVLTAAQLATLTPPAVFNGVVTNAGTFAVQATGTVAVNNFPASQVVTLASTTITGSVAVTGTFYPATQPVSGTVTVVFPSSPIVWIEGSAGAVMDAVITAATAPANALATLVVNQTTAPSLTAGQSVAVQGDYQGSTFVKPYRRGQTSAQGTTIASSLAATNILAVGGAGIFVDLAALVITVTPLSAAAAPISFTATLGDGTKTYIYDLQADALGTTVLISNPAGPLNLSFEPPIPGATSATQWTITLSVNTVTVHVTAIGVLQKAS